MSAENTDAAADGHDDHAHHVLPLKVYIGVLGALLVLTVVTVAVAQVDLGGAGNIVVAMVVATIKASLVGLFFMHLLYDKKIYLFTLLSSVIFLAIFIVLTMFDTQRRDLINPERAQAVRERAVIYDKIEAKAAVGGYDHGDHGSGHDTHGSDDGHGGSDDGH
jgi:cytochrome c oxidase subunit 4